MTKIFATIWVITAFAALIGWQLAFHRGDTIERLEQSLRQCEIRNKEDDEYIESKDKALYEDAQTIGKLREQVKKASSICECYNSRSDDAVLNILHNHHKTSK